MVDVTDRSRRRWIVLGIVLGLVAWPIGVRAEPPSRPNIVVILADDLGAGDLGCFGGTLAKTPNIDRLARSGTRFTQYYAGAPICSPSRAALLTGQYPGRWQITSFLQDRAGNHACGQRDFLDPAAPTLPRILRTAGYATGHFGKWHLGGGRDVHDAPKFAAYGVDAHAGTYESPEPHPDITSTRWIFSTTDKTKRWDRSAFFVDRALGFLRENQGRHQPSFVNVWLDDPHTPWIPSASAAAGESAENLRGVLEEMDRQVGRLVDGIAQMGLSSTTLILFLSDNGPLPPFGSSRTVGQRGSKLSLYEGGIRVPLIAAWPGVAAGDRVDGQSVLSALDLLPTLAAIAGAKLPDGVAFDGYDRSAALIGGHPQLDRPRPLFWEYGRNDTAFKYPGIPRNRSPQLAARDGQWIALVNADGSRRELFDLTADPQQNHDVAGQHPEVARRLADQVIHWRQSLP